MHNDCQNVFIVEVASLILLDKLTMKHNSHSSVNCTNNNRIEID